MLNPGTKLGSHEILALIGVGGMGEVEAFWRSAILLGGSRQPKSRAQRVFCAPDDFAGRGISLNA